MGGRLTRLMERKTDSRDNEVAEGSNSIRTMVDVTFEKKGADIYGRLL